MFDREGELAEIKSALAQLENLIEQEKEQLRKSLTREQRACVAELIDLSHHAGRLRAILAPIPIGDPVIG
jgi:hypothetical protein